MPPQKRGKSDSAKGTPPEFISAVQSRFGGFLNIDLAATEADRKAGRYISPEEDSLSMDWAALPELQRPQGLAWLNPPYDRIEPWAWKCAETMKDPRVKGRILFLVPASVGAKWFGGIGLGQGPVLLPARPDSIHGREMAVSQGQYPCGLWREARR